MAKAALPMTAYSSIKELKLVRQGGFYVIMDSRIPERNDEDLTGEQSQRNYRCPVCRRSL